MFVRSLLVLSMIMSAGAAMAQPVTPELQALSAMLGQSQQREFQLNTRIVELQKQLADKDVPAGAPASKGVPPPVVEAPKP